MSELPTREQLKKRVEGYLDPTRGLGIPTTPEGAVAWGEEYLKRYAKENGIPTSVDDIKRIASGALTDELRSQGIPITSLPTSQQELLAALRDGSAAYAASQFGVDPSSIELTVNALQDGKLSSGEIEDIGGAAGAIAGAALAQSFGIPAPIGAFIGGKIGAGVGMWVSGALGISASERAEQRRKANAAARAGFRREYEQYSGLCHELRAQQERVYEAALTNVSDQWLRYELRIGWKFDLRWFRPTYVETRSPFRLRDGSGFSVGLGGGVICYPDSSGTPKVGSIVCGPAVALNAGPLPYCLRDDGCLYPDTVEVSNFDPLYRRAASALAVHGITPDLVFQGGACDAIVDPNKAFGAGFDENGPEQVRWRNTQLKALNDRLSVSERLNSAYLMVVSDLSKTANTVATEIHMRALYDQSQRDSQALARSLYMAARDL